MKEIILDSGKKSYSINGCEISFNPTDIHFMEGLYNVLDALDSMAEERKRETSSVSNAKEIFELSRRYDKEMRDRLDNAVGGPVSEAVAGDMNIYALSDGLPIFANIILAIMDEMDTGIADQAERGNPRLEALLSKYKKGSGR